MGTMVSQITCVLNVCSTACLDADQRKHHSSASLPFARGFHRWPVDFPSQRASDAECFHLMTSSWSPNRQRPRLCSLTETQSWWKTIYLVCEWALNTLRPKWDGRHFPDDISNTFSWVKISWFRLKFHWSLLTMLQLIICQHWFR